MMSLALPLLLLIGLAVALFAVSAARKQRETSLVKGERTGKLKALEVHCRQLAERMRFDRMAIGKDGRCAVGYLPQARRVVFVDSAWVDGSASVKGEVRAFDVGAEDLVAAEVEQLSWTKGAARGDGEPMVRSVMLRVVTLDADAPMHQVEFLGEDTPVGSSAHLDAVQAAGRWEGLVRALVTSAARDAVAGQAVAGLSDEEARRERAMNLASKVLAARERREQVRDELSQRQAHAR